MVPAGAISLRPPTAVAEVPLFEHEAAAPAIETFQAALGGRAHLTEELLASPDLTTPIRKVLTLILDPRFDQYPLAAICAKAQITPGEFFAAFRDATLAKATILALRTVATKLTEVVTAVITDALDHPALCPLCTGSKKYLHVPKKGDPSIVDCPRCNGTGHVIVAADADKQKTVLELAGLLKKGGGISIGMQQTAVAQAAATSTSPTSGVTLAQQQQVIHDILRGTPLVLDSLPVEDAAAGAG